MRVSAVLQVQFPQARFVTGDTFAATQSRTGHSRDRYQQGEVHSKPNIQQSKLPDFSVIKKKMKLILKHSKTSRSNKQFSSNTISLLFLLICACTTIMASCSSYRFRNSDCFERELTKSDYKLVLHQIDSVFQINPPFCNMRDGNINCKCTHESILEVKIKTKCDVSYLFHFNKNLHLTQSITVLPEIH